MGEVWDVKWCVDGESEADAEQGALAWYSTDPCQAKLFLGTTD